LQRAGRVLHLGDRWHDRRGRGGRRLTLRRRERGGQADREVFSAAVSDGNADFASVANAAALVRTLFSAVCRELRPFLATSTLSRLLTEVLRLAASVQ
jgi:hypothetical protein